MNNINKNDLLKLLDYALDEYGDPRHISPELMRNGTVSMNFGTLDAEISMVEAKNNELYLRKYIVKNDNGNGFSFLLGHSAMLFANSAKKFREKLVAVKCIKGIITLKREVFKQITIPAAVIMLGENITETWFTSVGSVDSLLEVFCGDLSSLKRVYYLENISAENLNPEYYNGDDKIIEEALKGFQTAKLEEIAEIISGKKAKKEFLSENGIAYLRGRDLQKGKIMKPELYVNSDNVQKFANCILQEGDLLLTKHFGQNKLTFVTEGDLPAIASEGLIIIRAFGVSEQYLYKYLTSQTGNEVFNKQMSRIQKGVTIPSISISDLKQLLVPIIDDKAIQEIDSKSHITKENVISVSRSLLNGLMLERDIENIVYADLISVGWQEESMKRCDAIRDEEDYVNVKEKVRTLPDLSYKLDDGRYIYIEIKMDLQHITPDWIERMKAVLKNSKYSFLIITTCVYYEIHKAGINASLKLLKAPTIQDILDWEKEVLGLVQCQ